MSYPYSAILGWSHSRYQRFVFCKRNYFLHYYTVRAPVINREKLKRLKALTCYKMEIGTIVHELIEIVLKKMASSKREVDKDRFKQYVLGQIDIAFQKEYAELYYKQSSMSKEQFQKAVIRKFRVFLKSSLYRWLIKQIDAGATNPADWIIEPAGYGETRLANLKAYCKVDFLMPTKDKIQIFDWKTGAKKDEHDGQLIAYALTAMEEYGYAPERIATNLVYIDDERLSIINRVPDPTEITGFAETVRSQTAEMHEMCIDVERNIPKAMKEFPLSTDMAKCSKCNFREYCWPGI